MRTLEEEQYPQHYRSRSGSTGPVQEPLDNLVEKPAGIRAEDEPAAQSPAVDLPPLKEGHMAFSENQRGVSFDDLFGPHLKGARRIVITDAYIRLFFQARNLMELLELLARQKSEEEEIEVHLVTVQDEFNPENQLEFFQKMQDNLAPTGIRFAWEFIDSQTIHARHIITGHGWKILLDRGLDIFQRFKINDAFAITN